MASSVCFTSVCSFNTPSKPGLIVDNNSLPKMGFRVNDVFKGSRNARIQSLEAKAEDKNQSVKPKSIVCEDCEGNGNPICGELLYAVEQMVPNSVINAKVPELILLITSTDNLKPVACAGFAGGKGRFYAGTATELGFLVDL